jgi:hypothetical protein
MPELITGVTLAPILDRLRITYNRRIAPADLPGMARHWAKLLQGFTVEAIDAAADYHAASEKNFPRPSELKTAAREFLKRTNAVIPLRITDPDRCDICGERYEYREIEHRKVEIVRLPNGYERYVDTFDADGNPDLTGRGQPIMVRERSPIATLYHDPVKHGVTPGAHPLPDD